MAWRPQRYLIGGQLDNTHRESVTGWMVFVGLPEPVTFDLEGDFHRDIRGASIQFLGYATPKADARKAAEYLERFSLRQTGKVGDITAGLPPYDYGRTPYVEWYSNENGRVVLELERRQVRVTDTPIPYIESDRVLREQQARNVLERLKHIADALRQQEQRRSEGNNGSASSDATP